MEGCINIKVIKVKTPSDFLVSEVPGKGMSVEARDYNSFMQQLNEHLDNDQILKTPFTPQKGQVYAVKRLKDQRWYRVRVETWLERHNGLNASCFFLDNGLTEAIPIQTLRVIPSHFNHTRVPYQIKRYCLHGLHPLTLSISPAVKVVPKVCEVWDVSATQRMNELINESSILKAKVISVTPKGIHLVQLYLETLEGPFCLNEKLVEEKYCVESVDDSSDSEGSGTDSISYSSSDFLSSDSTSPVKKLKPKTRSKFKSVDYHGELMTELGLTNFGKVNGGNPCANKCSAAVQSKRSAKTDKQTDRQTSQQQISSVTENPPEPSILLQSGATPLHSNPILSSGSDMQSSSAQIRELEGFPGAGNSMNSTATFGPCYESTLKSHPTALDYYRQTVPKCLELSDSEASSNSDRTSITKNLHLIIGETSKLSDEKNGSGHDSDVSVNSLTKYETQKNRSLQDVVTNIQDKLASRSSSKATSPAPSPSVGSTISPIQSPVSLQDRPSSVSVISGFRGLGRGRMAYSDTETEDFSRRLLLNSQNRTLEMSPPAFRLPPGTEQSFLSGDDQGLNSEEKMAGCMPKLGTSCNNSGEKGDNFPSSTSRDSQVSFSLQSFLLTDNSAKPARCKADPDLSDNFMNLGNSGTSELQITYPVDTSVGATDNVDTGMLPTCEAASNLQESDSVLAGLLAQDTSAPTHRTRRPNLPQKAKVGNKPVPSRVCFSDNEPAQSKSRKDEVAVKSPDSSPTPPQVNQKNTALKSILKNCANALPVESEATPVQQMSPLTISRSNFSSDRSTDDYSDQSDLEDPRYRRDCIGKKILANKLFAQLSKQHKELNTPEWESEQPGKYGKSYRPFDGVFVASDKVLHPYETLDDAPFHGHVKKVLRQRNLSIPRLIHAYCWRVILRGRDVIGIATNMTKERREILAYLAPLLSQLIECRNYPPGGGPLVLIMCSTWRRAQTIQFYCEEVLEGATRPRVMTMFGGGCEDGYNIPLINGCEILISTPLCLSRKLGKYVNLRRLGHLVIDEAETVMGNFTEQVSQVMNLFKTVLKERGQQTASPRQLLVFGSQWTNKMESFWNAYMVEPVLVITSQYEASVFGGVKHFTTVVRHNQRLSKLVELMESLMLTDKRIVIFTSDDEEANTLYHTLSTQSYYVLLAIDGTDFTPVLKEWNLPHKDPSHPILICTDSVAFDLNITNASVIIQYGMAASKTTFGNRVNFTRDNYRKSISPEKRTVIPSNYIFVTQNCEKMINCLVDMLERTKSRIPADLRELGEGMFEGREQSKPMELCYYLKAFGMCKLKSRCHKRHLIREELDKPRLLTNYPVPNQGEIKVLVTYVNNASRFYVRILKHRTLDGTIHELGSLYNLLQRALQGWYAVPENRFENGPVQYGDLCCSPEDFCRVQVQDVGNLERYATQRHKKIKIFYVDDGRTEEVKASSLLKLPDNFKNIPFQAVEAYLCRIIPLDSDTDWVPKADAYMYSQVNAIELWGKIVLSLGGTVWLDPLVERVYHKSIQVTTTNTQIRTSLIRRGYAIDNPQHLEMLYKACKGKLKLPDYNRSVLEVQPEVESLPEGGEDEAGVVTLVYLSACATPDNFCLQLQDTHEELERLMKTLNGKGEGLKCLLNERKFTPGTLCLVKFSVDDSWYRAQILTVNSDDTVEVLFVDYGDTEVVSRLHVKDIPEKYLKLPFQAIECSLNAVSPPGGSWEESSGDALWDMVHHYDGDRRLLRVQVKGKQAAKYLGPHHYLVDLVFTSCDEEVNVLRELVYRGHVVTDTTTVQPLFPKPVTGAEKTVPVKLCQKVTDKCYSVYNLKKSLMLLPSLITLRDMVETGMEDGNLSDEEKDEVILNLWSLIRYTSSLSVCTTLLPTLTQIIQHNPSLLLTVLEKRFVPHLCSEVCRNTSTEVRLSCIRSLLSLHQNEGVVNLLSKLENIEALVTSVKESESLKVKTLITELLARMCTGSERTLSNVKAMKGIDVLYQEMSQHKMDVDFSEAFAHFFAVVGDLQTEEYYSDFRKDGLLEFIVSLIKETNSLQVIRWTTHLLHRLSERSRKNKTLVLEAGYVPVLKGLPQRFPNLVSELSHQWNHLLTSLDVKAPREQLSSPSAMIVRGKLSTDIQHALGRSISPQVSWYQNSFRVVLSVKLIGVTENSLTVTYSETSVQVRAVCEGCLYGFEFNLCDTIIPSSSHEEIRAKEILISLKKEQKGRWKRLLKGKDKPVFLSIDYERIQDSSDSEPEDSDDNLFIVKHSTRGKPLPEREAAVKTDGETDVLQQPAYYDSSDSDDSLEENGNFSDDFDFFKI